MDNSKDENRTKKVNSAAKYSAIGFQMIATIGLFSFIGYKIDESQKNEHHLFLAIFGLVGVGLALFQVIKQVTKHN